jgi:hypothetical protein
MPLLETKGAASAQGFGLTLQQAAANYIEDCFSVWLYTGTGSAQTITNGIDLSTKGGLVWSKSRSPNPLNHFLCDTVRGRAYYLLSDWNGAQQGPSPAGRDISSFNSNGYSLGINANADINNNGQNFVSWTFREQPKFFDVVTYTGNGAVRNIAHSLGSVPGCIIIKTTSTTYNWYVYHRSTGNAQALVLNATFASAGSGAWNNTTPTSTVFTVDGTSEVNENGQTYVAYLFAHDAGGFGLTGTDNVISCGSFTTNGSGQATVSLGYEPQWLLWKRSDSDSNWLLLDNMRSWNVGGNDFLLRPNTSDVESTGANYGFPTATGFYMENMAASATYIYIAIRRGPMKTPTTGTSVFTTNTYTGTGAARTITTGFVTDLVIGQRLDDVSGHATADRLRGDTLYLQTSTTGAEATSDGGSQDITGFDFMTGYGLGVPNNSWMNNSGSSCANWAFRRAPGFFDVVCYTGDAADPRSITHNLTATPELMIVKRRDASANWRVYSAATGATNQLFLNLTDASAASSGAWSNTAPTSSAFTVGFLNNASGATYVAYLFATVAGVSKVGSYTGTGALQTINCGFTGGARFVLIKRTDSTGDWWVYDSARGITSGNDPYLFLNSTAAQVTGTNYVDTTSVGFQVTAAAPAGLNAAGGTFLFLAVA